MAECECGKCGGEGSFLVSRWIVCSYCSGSGCIHCNFNGGETVYTTVTCDECGGSGSVPC
jgi:DnaJ-class molecular chaperone